MSETSLRRPAVCLSFRSAERYLGGIYSTFLVVGLVFVLILDQTIQPHEFAHSTFVPWYRRCFFSLLLSLPYLLCLQPPSLENCMEKLMEQHNLVSCVQTLGVQITLLDPRYASILFGIYHGFIDCLVNSICAFKYHPTCSCFTSDALMHLHEQNHYHFIYNWCTG